MDFDDMVDRCGWNDGTQAGILREFINTHGLADEFNKWVEDHYGWELEQEEVEEG
jgi:hypothetical protein